ncbi:MAG: hypothetical protein HY553_00400 [Elusimicrobia bacterium]|nr:hypothetical protein [Elusimicrobiota bacterium]
MKIVWVERLTLPDLARLWAEAALSGAEVRYDERKATGAAKRALAALAPARLKPAKLTLGLKDSAGHALTYRVHEELERALRPFAERLRGEPTFSDARSRSALVSYLCTPLLPRVSFLVMAEAAAASEPAASHVFHVVGHPFNRFLPEPSGRGRLRESWSPRGALRAAFAPLALLARAFSVALLPRRDRTDLSSARPGVWVQYMEVEAVGFGSRVFWHRHARLPGADKVFVFDLPDVACDAAAREHARRLGFGWIDCRDPVAASRPGLARLAGLAAGLFAGTADGPWWLRFFRLELELLTALWEDVYRRHRVKLLWQGQEYWWRQSAQARAIDRAGGAMFGLHWSEFPFLAEPIHASPQHVFFVWGRNNLGWLRGKGHDVSEILPSGLWLVPPPAAPDPFGPLRPGGRFKLALYDSGYAYDLFQTPESLASFMDFCLSLLERHPDWRAVLKPKGTADYSGLPGGARLNSRLRSLAADGRLAVLDWNTSPAAVGPRADLAVAYGYNSAGWVTAAFGGRAVLWDCCGWSRHPLYRDPRQKILYLDLLDLEGAIVAAAAGDSTIGDLAPWRKLVNHFDDAKAPERIAGWMDDFLSLLADGRSSSEAVRESAERYREAHRVPPEFYQGEAWWTPPRTDPARRTA